MKPFYYSALVTWACGLLLAVDFNFCAIALSEQDKRDNAMPTGQSFANAQATQPSEEKLKEIAKSITVKVYAGDNRGTGVLLSKEGKIYTVVTYANLIERDKSYRIETGDGKTHQATLLIKGDSFADKNLVLLQFQATDDYAIADVDTGLLSSGDKVYGAGFSEGNEQSVFGTGILIWSLSKPLTGGYEAGISKLTQAGASGGALLNERGQLVGILAPENLNISDNEYVHEDGSRPSENQINLIRHNDSRLAIGIDPAIKLKSHSIVTQIDKIAQQITVRIDSAKHGNGSGVIIAKERNTYYVLTAAHVVANQDEYQIVTPDGQSYTINKEVVKTFERVDLALVPFNSKKNYSVATLADYKIESEVPVSDNRQGGSSGPVVFLSGFPGKDSNASTRKLTSGRVVNQESSFLEAKNSFSLLEGYELVYSNPSEPGMSGGPVLDRLGQVIGINAAAESEIEYEPNSGQVTEIYLGQSLGVPVRNFLELINKTSINSQLLNVETSTAPTIDESLFLSYLDNKYMINDRTFVYPPPSESASAFELLNWGNYLWRKEQVYAENFDEPDAVDILKKAIELKPDFYQAYYALGIALEQNLQYEEAIAAFNKAIQIQPNFYEAQYRKAEALRQTDKYLEALASVDKAIQLNPEDAALYLLRGQILIPLNRYSEAQAAFTQAIDRKPNFFSYYYRGEVRSDIGDAQGAVSDFNKASELNPREAQIYFMRGLNYTNLANEKAAIADLDKAIELAEPLLTLPFEASRAAVGFHFGDYQDAIAKCSKVMKSAEGWLITPYVCLAQSYRRLGDYQKALVEYDKMLERIMAKKVVNQDSFSNQASAYSGRSVVYAELGNFEKAYADANKAIELEPNNFNNYFSRSYYHLLTKNFQGAIADANTAIKIRPSDPKAYVLRAKILARQGEVKKGLAEIDKALANNPKSIDAIAMKGAIQYEIGNLEETINLWQKVVKINRDPLYKLALAAAFYKKGEQKQGLAMAKQALQSNPNLKNIAFFKSFFWGDRLSSDTQKLLASF